MTTSSLPAITVVEVPIDDLRPDPANPRRISEDELDALEPACASSASSSRSSPAARMPPSSAAISAWSRHDGSG